MKRCILYILIMVAVLCAPVEGTDVAKLRPVETVVLYKIGKDYHIRTDTNDVGEGESVQAAFDDLLLTTPGVIYLDTAEYVLVHEGAVEDVEQLRSHLKRSVQLCSFSGELDIVAVSKYLPVHGKLPILSQWNPGEELPVLTMHNDRLRIE